MLSFPLISDVIPVKFHPYTSGTRKTLLRIDYHNDRSDDPTYRQIEHFRKNLHLLFTGHGIANHVDNRLLRCDKSFQSIADSDAHFFQKNVQEDLIMAQFMRANIMPT
jgi:hypothetical protein